VKYDYKKEISELAKSGVFDTYMLSKARKYELAFMLLDSLPADEVFSLITDSIGDIDKHSGTYTGLCCFIAILRANKMTFSTMKEFSGDANDQQSFFNRHFNDLRDLFLSAVIDRIDRDLYMRYKEIQVLFAKNDRLDLAISYSDPLLSVFIEKLDEINFKAEAKTKEGW
jgi:hypothetical protein